MFMSDFVFFFNAIVFIYFEMVTFVVCGEVSSGIGCNQCAQVIPDFCTQGSLVRALERHTKGQTCLVACQSNAFPAVLYFSHPLKLFDHISNLEFLLLGNFQVFYYKECCH